MKDVCFMIMPYGTRETGAPAGTGPAKVDFNALWNDVYEPVIRELGYQPVRADQDLGAVIIKDMIERLTIADLVLADISIANANVYYEVGVRHAAAPKGCVLLSANWAKPAFDLAQIRHLQFPLQTTTLEPAEAEALRKDLVARIAADRGESPVYALMPGYPPPTMSSASSFADLVQSIATFQGKIRAAENIAEKAPRKAAVQKLVDDYFASGRGIQSVALELLPIVRDHVGWTDVLTYIDRLPPALQELPFVREQRALATSKSGDHHEAIAALETLIQLSGETSERRGLLGGRYKKLWREATEPPAAARYLDRAIENYTAAMYLDLNDYFSPSNLPRLLRTRGRGGDEALARMAAEVARAGCARREKMDPDDPWLRLTRLGQAVDDQDAQSTGAIVGEAVARDYPQWMYDTTAADLKTSVALVRDPQRREELVAALAPLKIAF